MGEYAGTLLFQYGDAESLAERLQRLLSLPSDEAQRIGAYLRERVIAFHSLSNLAEKLVKLFYDLIW